MLIFTSFLPTYIAANFILKIVLYAPGYVAVRAQGGYLEIRLIRINFRALLDSICEVSQVNIAPQAKLFLMVAFKQPLSPLLFCGPRKSGRGL